jgi:hypothetical protein
VELQNGNGDDREAIISREYQKIEDALRRIITAQGREGLLTDYLILSAVQSFDSDGGLLTNTGWHTNPANGMPYHRMIGLIEYNRELMLKEAVDVEDT